MTVVVVGWLAQGPVAIHPYQVGAGIGFPWLTFYFSDHPIGASSFYANVAGNGRHLLAPEHTRKLTYFQENKPKWFGWQSVFILSAIFVNFRPPGPQESYPAVGCLAFGYNVLAKSYGLRFLAAFAGGACMAFGARLAGGCTSGHGISGTMQLALSSWNSTGRRLVRGRHRHRPPDVWRHSMLPAVFGVVFGFLLQRGGMGKYQVLLGQLLLTDWSVVKVMMTAIVAGMAGVLTMQAQGLVKWPIPEADPAGGEHRRGVDFPGWICPIGLLPGFRRRCFG